ncbi:MAG TPA: hypothetical protein VIY48_01445 [Candidatus Paceibacterota bacterium]
MAVGFLTEQLGANAKVRVRIAWGANINANSSTWTWTDVTSDVQQENGKFINITPMGKPPEATQTPPATVQFTLDNRPTVTDPHGPYSKNQPLCSNWPNVRTYTPVQVQVTLDGGTNYWTMFQGEVSDWEPDWDKTGNYAVTIVTARGRMQRQNQHNDPLRSAMERYIANMTPVPVGYWPLEDGPNTLQAQSPIAGISSAVRQYDNGFALPLPAWGTYSNTAPGSGVGANFQNGGTVTAPVIGGTASTTGWSIAFAFNFGSTFQSTDFIVPITFITANGDYWYFTMNLGSPNDYEWRFHHLTPTGSTDSAVTASSTWANTFNPFDDQEHLFFATAVQSGANIAWTFKIYKDDSAVYTYTGSIASQTLNAITNVSIGNDGTTASFPWTIQHVTVWNGYNTVTPDTLIFKLYGDRGLENPHDRMSRLCGEEGVEFTGDGFYDSSVLMGPQPTKSFMDNLRLCEVSDDGFMYDGLNAGINYQGLSQRNDQSTAITIAITDLAKDFNPLDNDLQAINRVRVDRDGGSFYIDERTTGILGSGADGIGPAGGSVTISNNKDDLLPHRAGWETWKGTVPGFRYPVLYLDIAARPSLATKWINRADGGTGPITPGSKMVVTSPASYATQHPVEDLELTIVGWAMRISRFMWQIDVQCENNHKYDVHKINASAFGRIETSGSQIAVAAASGATSIYVQSTLDEPWITSDVSAADFSQNIYVDGIKVAVSAITNGASDSFTRTTANGFGTATSGQVWSTSGGSASDYSTNGSSGLQSNGSVGVIRYCILPIGCSDVDFNVDVSLPVTSPTGATISQWAFARFTDVNNHYIARLDLSTAGVTTLVISKRVSGTLTGITSVQVSTAAHVANEVWRVRFAVIGSALKAKAWIPASQGEPEWQLSITDTALTTGTNIAVATRLETGNTNTLPVVSTWDNLTLSNPQLFTVTGVTKNLVAGRVVNLWNPGVLRL